MNNFIRAFSVLMLMLCSAGTAFGWTLYVTNWANKVVTIHTSWAGSAWAFGKCFSCCDDHATLQPGQRIGIDAGECLLQELRVDGGSPYTSSGQRAYNDMYIIGPVDNTVYAGRLGEGLGDVTGKVDQITLLNATPYPATHVKIEIASLNNESDYRVLKPENTNSSIPAGKDVVFDMIANYYIRRIEATINNKNIVKIIPRNRKARWASYSTTFFISGPPDGSNPQIVKLIQ